MAKRALVGALLVGGTVAALSYFVSGAGAPPPLPGDTRHGSAAGGAASRLGTDVGAGGAQYVAELERRIVALESEVAAAALERQGLEERLETLAEQLAALPGSTNGAERAAAVAAVAPPTDASPAVAEDAAALDAHATAVERALVAAGIDPATATDMKRKRDELTLAEIYLRDQATREGWMESPRFGEEMAAIDQQRTPIRDEIGDDRYDRYLAALGEPNRVRVDEVLAASPAAQAGLQAGDLVLRYGETRIFAPGELVAETRSGTAGEPVRIEVVRRGQRIQIDVPRGPLGLTIAASHANPDDA